jgi:type IX secretion system PorP/SprF family membrane protein
MYRGLILFLTVTTIFLLAGNIVAAQKVVGYRYGSGINPSFAGAEEKGIVRLDYISTYPGSGYNLNSFNLSFDTFLDFAHGGAGFNLLSDHPGGLMTDVRALFSYSYHLQISRDLFLFAGMNAGFIYRSINTGKLIFPDQIDPLNGVTTTGNEVITHPSSVFFDMGTGFLITYKNTSLSLNAGHLFQPDLSKEAVNGAQLPRTYGIQVFSRFKAGNGDLFFVPYAEVSAGGGESLVAAGGAIEYGRIGLGVLGIAEESGKNIQTSVKAGAGNLDFLYSFRFSLMSENIGLPIALVHQLSVHLSLNIVDKRNTIKTIKFPDL